MKFKPLLVLLLLFGSLIPASVLAAEPTGYTYRIQTVYYSQDPITDYATYLDIDTTTLKTALPSEWQNQTKVYNVDTDSDCYHYIEEINSTYYRVWFKTDFLSGNTHINFYIGGTENLGNADDVFQYYNESINLSNIVYDWSNDFETNTSHLDNDTYTYTIQADGDTNVAYSATSIGIELTTDELTQGRLDFQLKTDGSSNDIDIDYVYSGSTTSGPVSSYYMTASTWYNCSLIYDDSGSTLYVNGEYESSTTHYPESELSYVRVAGSQLYIDNLSYSDLSNTAYGDFLNITTISSDSEIIADVTLKNSYSKLAIISDTSEILTEFSNQTNGTYSEISLSNLAIKNISCEAGSSESRGYWIEYDGSDYWAWIKTNGSETVTVEQTGSYSPNGSAVFTFFDDFIGDTLDEIWTVSGSSYTVSDGELAITNRDTRIMSVSSYQSPYLHYSLRNTAITNQMGLTLTSIQTGGGVKYFFLTSGDKDWYVDNNGDGSYEYDQNLFTETATDIFQGTLKITDSTATLEGDSSGTAYSATGGEPIHPYMLG